MTFNHIRVAPLATSVGAEISGVDLAPPPGGLGLAEIRRALGEYGVVFFRDQQLTPDQHIAFARSFGAIDVNRFFAAVPGYPMIAEVRKEPEQRYASAAELADDLVRYQHGEPIQARPVGHVERGVKWVKRNPVVSGATAAVVLALALGTGISLWYANDALAQSRREAGNSRETERRPRQPDRYRRADTR